MSFFLGILFSYSQTTYYVSKSGNDSNNGTSLSTPFLTIGKAISVISAGDKIYIRHGVYHEDLTLNNLDATSSNKTLISNYNEEKVIIDGTIPISNTWLDDQIEGTPVKKIESFTSTITQLFVGNNQMVMARWPNAQFSDLSIYDHDNWAEGVETGSSDGSIIIDETVENPGSLDLTNSIGVLNLGSFKTYNRVINSHTQQAGNDVFTYSNQIGSGFKTKHYYFFFEGKKEFIDAKSEWFLDNSNDILYLNPPTGVDLNKVPIRGKVRDYSISISGSEYLKIKGLTFFATTLKAQGSSNLEIESCNFYYPSNSQRMLGNLAGANVTTLGTGSGNSARVDSSTVSGCLFIDTEGEALVVFGDDNTIKNSYFRNIDWSATELNGLMVSVYVNGNNNKFNNNEIYNTGASATVWPGTASEFSYNIVSSTGHAQSDGAVFQGTSACVAGSEVHHNFVYDTEKYAFRYDAPGGDASQAGSFGKMHHNIADNTLGLMIKGNNQVIAHNTVLNTISNRNDIIILSEDCSNNSTWFYNNLAERIGAHRSDATFSAPGTSPMPMGGVGYIKNGNNWEFCDSGDSFYSGTGTGSSTSNYDGINVSRPGITYDSNIESLISYNAGNGKSMADYVPTSNKILDQGASPTNVVSTSLTTTAALNTIIPQVVSGSSVDIGALESGALWTPGIDGWTPNQTIDLMSIFALESSIVTNSLILHFDPSNTFCYSGQGNTIYDLSQNDNNGSLNGPTLTNTKGGEIYFDGSDDYIQLGSPFSYNQHTIEFWIHNESDGGNWVWDARDSNNDGYILFYYDSNPQYDVGNDDNSSYSGTHSNLWRHVVATKDGSQTKLYVNGNLKHTVASSYTINTTTNARIGARSFDPVNNFFKGKVAITRFYSRSLSAEEITQNFDADKARFGVAPFDITLSQFDKSGLSLYLDGANPDSYSGSGNTWYDLSGNGNNFTVYGSPFFNDEMKGGTFVFDETNDYAKSVTSTVLNRNEYTKLAIFYPKSSTKNIISGGTDAAHAFYMKSSNNKITAGHNSTWNRVGYTLPSGNMLDKWNFGAVSFSSSSGWKLYYNGSLVDSDNNTDVSNGSGLVRIAAHNDGANLFDGRIPVALIFDRVLSASEIENIYNHFAPRYNLTYGTSTLTIDEFSLAGTEVGVLAGVDSDTQYNDFSYSLISGDGTNDRDNSSFTISGTQLLLNNSNISYNNTQQLKIYVQISDGPFTFNKAFVINVNNINIPPIDIGLTSNTIAENSVIGSSVGTLSAVDSDTSISSLTFTLASSGDARDDDNASFSISGTTLLTSTTLDYETKNSYNIYINVNDGTANFAKAFTISVTNVNEPITDINLLNIESKNMVLYLDAKDSNSYPGNGNIWYDLSGYNNHGTISGATYNSGEGGGISFDGSNDKIIIPHSSSLNFDDEVTVFYTLKPSWSSSAYTPSVSKGIKDNFNFSTWIGTDKKIDISTENGGGQQENVNSLRPAYDATSNISTNNWYTIAITIDSSNNQKTYINGSSVGVTKTIQLGATNNHNLIIGEIPGYSHSTYGDGEIGKVVLYNSALSAEKIASNYIVMSSSSTPSSVNISVTEKVPIGTLAGNLTATDSDTTDFTFSLVSGNGTNDQHNSSFTISGTNLLVNGFIDYEQTPSLNVNIRASDGVNTFTKAFVISVININEIPVITSTTLASDNSVVSVTFSEAVFDTNSGSGALEVGDFSLTINGGTATLTSSTPSSISSQGNTYGLGIPLSGNANGSEVLTVAPVVNSIYDANAAVASTTQTSNTINLYGDSDGDGVNDPVDLCPNTPNGESVDADGCAESQKDPDNDGVTGVNDNCPTTYNPSQTDTDGDGIGDACDPDDDNDGIADGSDNCPLDPNSNQVDTDSDNIGNLCDSDDDNDGYEDQRDAFPLDPSEWDDTDSDGIGNNADPNDDNDQCLDEDDAFPLDRTECLDTDGDGIGNNADPDDDNDGYEDQKDVFPLDPNEWIDTDGDGVGNNTDNDDDGDGYLDEDEIACGSDPLRTAGSGRPKDYDQDFIPDCVDPDDDNDGCLDQEDAFPLNERECKDSDGDGVGDESDFDDDNDGVWDDQDAFPLDPNETTDTDGDGIGDNVDPDKNNDGFPDDKLKVSQVLTPGQPGIESTWKIINLDRYPSANVKVYAPSGILVFASWDYRNNWNGVDIHTGQELPTGPYYYLVDKGDGSDVLSGWLYIFTDK